MKTLYDLNLDHALAGGGFGPRHPEPFDLELAVTAACRAHEHAPPAVRELAVLRVQFPAVLQPLQPGDAFAGRIRYPLVSFTPQAGGLGYDCRAGDIRRVLAARPVGAARRAEVEAMLAWWEGRSSRERVRAAYPPEVARVLPSDAYDREPGLAYPLYRLAGTILDYAKLVRLGLPGLQAEVAARRAAEPAESAGAVFLAGLAGALDLLADSARAYAAQARALAAAATDPAAAADLAAVADALGAVAERPPATLREAIQLGWLYALHAGTWDYGRLDVALGPVLAADLAAGRLDEDGAARLLARWYALIRAYDNMYDNRIIVGGVGRPDPAAADAFARCAIAAVRRARLNQPQLTLRFHAGQDPRLMALALTALGEGCTFPMLYNDDVNVPAVAAAFGVPRTEAEQYTPYGCGEYILGPGTVGTPSGLINLAACVLAVLHGPDAPGLIGRTGPAGPPRERLDTFAAFWAAYAAQVEAHVAALAEQERIEYDVCGREAPYLFLSGLSDACIARARPIFAGGIRRLGGTVETYGNTNAADALHAVEELVYRRRTLTLAELAAACADGFAGAAGAAVRRRLLAVPKYGNDDDGADAMAARVHEHVCRAARREAARVGLDSYLVVVINNWFNTVLGRVTPATPDGRGAGEPLANGNNPQAGMDRSGATAFLNSLTKLRPDLHAGAVQNMKFARELFTRHRPKLEALLAGYWARGGTQAMVTVVSPDDLRAAMAEPAKWGHLMVRVGGFSARFIDLPPDAQGDLLRRTLHQ